MTMHNELRALRSHCYTQKEIGQGAHPESCARRAGDAYGEVARKIDAILAEYAEASDDAATHILHHIDMMYPAMWEGVPKAARTSLRNVIRQQFELSAAAKAEEE